MILLLMEEILHQLRLVVDIPIIYKVLYFPGGCLGFLPSTVSYSDFYCKCIVGFHPLGDLCQEILVQLDVEEARDRGSP